MTDEAQIPEQILNNKNKHSVRCNYCYSLILKPQFGEYVEHEFEMPLMQQKHRKNTEIIETEVLKNFWCIDDIFTFENIGFSNTVDNRKFLICADCEMGPVGYHEIANKKCYVALKRVRHGSEPDAVMEPVTDEEENDV